MTRGIPLGLLALGAQILIACDGKPTARSSPPPPAVTVARPLQKTVAEWDEYTGRFTAVETVEVRARVSGFIESVHFKEGQPVKQGDLLFVIDPRPYRIASSRRRPTWSGRRQSTRSHRSTYNVPRHWCAARP